MKWGRACYTVTRSLGHSRYMALRSFFVGFFGAGELEGEFTVEDIYEVVE